MSTQADNAGTRATRGVEALVSAALASVRRSLDRVLLLWFGLSGFYALYRVPTHARGADGWVLQEIFDNEAWILTTLAVTALASAVALRLFLGRGREALRPDGALGAYAGVFVLLGIAPAMLLLRLHPPALGAPRADLREDLIGAARGLVIGLAMVWVCLRLTLWPIGRLLGDRRVTGEQSWILMRGAVADYAGALVVLAAPMVMLDYGLRVLTAQAAPLIDQVAGPPLRAAVCITAAAVAAEVYRKRLRL